MLQSLDLPLPGLTPEAAPVEARADVLSRARELAARSPRPKSPAPVPIGVWKPQSRDGELTFVRPEPAGPGDPWPPQEALAAKPPAGARRICFLGESAAAGWFYAPHLTPALVLQRQLEAAAGGGTWDVVNLAKVDLSAPELMALAGSVPQLHPDVVVVFAGNNWPHRYQPPPPGAPGAAEAALAFRDGGMAGLARWSERQTERIAEEVLARLARLSAESGVPVVVVVPEVNLADFDRTGPIAWLPGAGAAAWHAAAAEARGRLAERDLAGAEAAARRMIALDGGHAAASQRLLARALAGQGRMEEAAAACRAEVDARAWDNRPFVPAATSAVRRVLRERGAALGMRVVDLAAVFAEHGGSPLPGRAYFLDYCHLTPQGMAVSMAAVASEALSLAGAGDAPGWRAVLGRAGLPEVAPEVEGRARFMAALYTRHWTATDEPSPAFDHWLEAALAASDGAADTMLGYVATRCVPAAALLFSSEQQRLFSRLDRSERHIWSAPHLDPEAVLAICSVLERHGRPARREVEDALVRHHAVRERAVDLLRPVYHWGLTDQPRPNSSLRNNPPAFYPAWSPRSHFCLVAEGGRPLRLELTARLGTVEQPRDGELQLLVNDEPVGRVRLDGAWRSHRLEVPAGPLRRGINRLTLHWPPLPPEGDAGLRRIGRRLDQRVGVDLHPVFGEVMTLRARRPG